MTAPKGPSTSGLELERTRTAWDHIASGYDEFVTPRWTLSERTLDHAELRPDMLLLDVASGSGALSIPAARRGAMVLAVDLSSAMIERLVKRARAEGLSNLEGRVMDGHALNLEDDTFDISASQFGVMLFPDLPRGLREMVRVTRPEGRVLMVTYRLPETVEFLTTFIGAMKEVVPKFTGLPSDPPPLPFQVADPIVLKQRMTEAGLKEVRVEADDEKIEFHSGHHMWNWVTNSNPIGAMMVADLTEEQKTEVQRVLDRMLRERSDGRSIAPLHNEVNIGIGTK